MSKPIETERLKEIRLELGYTQEQFAEIMEMSLSGYKKLESGEVKLSVEKIYILNKKLTLSADYILFGKKPQSGDVWVEVCKLPETDKMLVFLRLFSYFLKKGKKESDILNIAKATDKAVSEYFSTDD